MAAEAAEHAGYHGILCTGMQDRRRAAVMLIFTMSMILLLPSFNIAAGNRCMTRWNALLQRAKTRCDNSSSTVRLHNRWLRLVRGAPQPSAVSRNTTEAFYGN
jgi:hypothetical protein